jgi:hypothetical protein
MIQKGHVHSHSKNAPTNVHYTLISYLKQVVTQFQKDVAPSIGLHKLKAVVNGFLETHNTLPSISIGTLENVQERRI